MKEIVFKWIDYLEYEMEILNLREEIYVQEQGFSREVIFRHSTDPQGLHLAAFCSKELIGMVSAYVLPFNHSSLISLALPKEDKIFVQPTSYMLRKEFRKGCVGYLIGAILITNTYENIEFDRFVVFVIGPHAKLLNFYQQDFHFFSHGTYYTKFGEGSVLLTKRKKDYYDTYEKLKLNVNKLFNMDNVAFYFDL